MTRSISVMRAALVEYSTPGGLTSDAGGAFDAAFSSIGARSGPASPRTAREASDERSRYLSRVRGAGLAFVTPGRIIRHRFGGHLRAVRARPPIRRPLRTTA